jgi:hypothetical protein
MVWCRLLALLVPAAAAAMWLKKFTHAPTNQVYPPALRLHLLTCCRFGFNNGKTMVDGLDGEKTPSWEGGDFATIVQQLRLLGFNAVRLPFLFGNLYTLPPQVRGCWACCACFAGSIGKVVCSQVAIPV